MRFVGYTHWSTLGVLLRYYTLDTNGIKSIVLRLGIPKVSTKIYCLGPKPRLVLKKGVSPIEGELGVRESVVD